MGQFLAGGVGQRGTSLGRAAQPTRWLGLVGVLLLLGGGVRGADIKSQEEGEFVTVDAQSVVKYVLSCRKANGAFGPADQEYTDAAWNFPAVVTLMYFGEQPPQVEQVLQQGLGYPQGHVGAGHLQFFHAHALRQMLGKPAKGEHRRVRLEHQGWGIRYYGSPLGTSNDVFFKAGAGAAPDPRELSADTLYYYNLSSLSYLLQGLRFSGREAANPQQLIEYVRARQAPGGGFVDVRSSEEQPRDAEAHLAHTYHAVVSLTLLGHTFDQEQRQRIASFVRSCQLPSGAYGWNPQVDLPGNRGDVYYTLAGLNLLTQLGERPTKVAECQQWLNSLQNHDGGFGDQPGWRSRLFSTYCAVMAFDRLGNARQAITKKQVRKPELEVIPEGSFGIYQAVFKLPVVQPDELESLHKRGLHLLALKSDKFEDAERLLEEIKRRKLTMDVVLCPEAYPHRTRRSGGAVLDHIGNFTLDARWGAEPRDVWKRADEAGKKGLPWEGYRQQVLGPLRKIGSLTYPEQDFEMEYAYSAYDEGAAGGPSYNAMLAGFNWSPRDFVRVFPWRERYVDKLTLIADVDAHGDLAKWSPQLDHTRNLFLAKGPTYADFLDAAKNGRVVCVIAQPEGVASGVSYYGRTPAVDYVRRHLDQWRWWGTRP